MKVQTSQLSVLEGTIVSISTRPAFGDAVPEADILNILDEEDALLASLVTSIKFMDPQLASDYKIFLRKQVNRDTDKYCSVTIDCSVAASVPGDGTEVRASYLSKTKEWYTTYRLMLASSDQRTFHQLFHQLGLLYFRRLPSLLQAWNSPCSRCPCMRWHWLKTTRTNIGWISR